MRFRSGFAPCSSNQRTTLYDLPVGLRRVERITPEVEAMAGAAGVLWPSVLELLGSGAAFRQRHAAVAPGGLRSGDDFARIKHLGV